MNKNCEDTDILKFVGHQRFGTKTYVLAMISNEKGNNFVYYSD